MNIALVCFGIASISNVSGMEKVFVEMANEFIRRGHVVYAVWNDVPGIKPYYPLIPNVRSVNLGLGKIKVPLRYKIMREICKGLHIRAKNRVDTFKTEQLAKAFLLNIPLNNIDIFVCFEFNSFLVANYLSHKKIPIVVMVHNSIEDQIVPLTDLQRRQASEADVYQVLMPSYVEQAKRLLNTRIVYIPNIVPIIDDGNVADLAEHKIRYRIIHVGRVEGRQKRQLILVKAFVALSKKYPDWDLELYGPIGDCNYKSEIDSVIKSHNLDNRVIYKGITDHVLEALRESDIFAFPSSYEGFSLALTEAMSVGLPTVGFEYAPSVQDLIIDGKNGYLAKNEKEFTDKLELLMKNRDLRIKFGANARKEMEKYSPNIIWGKWEHLLINLIKDKSEA